MGFGCSDLLPLIHQKTPKSGFLHINRPDGVVYDFNCFLHQLGYVGATPAPVVTAAAAAASAAGAGGAEVVKRSAWRGTLPQLYNVMMRPIREWVCTLGAKVVWVSVDKGVPIFKRFRKGGGGPASKKSDEKQTDEDAAAAAAAAVTVPYPPFTEVDDQGNLIFCNPVTYRVESISAEIDVGRLLASERRLRKCVLDFFFRVMAGCGEANNLPTGAKIIISYSMDPEQSPVVLTKETGYQRGVACYRNNWLEADWDMSRAVYHLQKSEGCKSVLACSVDGDILGVFACHVYYRIFECGDSMKTTPLYLWNMNKGSNARLSEMVQFVFELETGAGLTVSDFIVTLCCCGNDYASKQDITPWIGAAMIWNAFVCLRKMSGPHSIAPLNPTQDDLKFSLDKVRAVYGTGAISDVGTQAATPEAQRALLQVSRMTALKRTIHRATDFARFAAYLYAMCTALRADRFSVNSGPSPDYISTEIHKLNIRMQKKKRKARNKGKGKGKRAKQDGGGAGTDRETADDENDDNDEETETHYDTFERARIGFKHCLAAWTGCAQLDEM